MEGSAPALVFPRAPWELYEPCVWPPSLRTMAASLEWDAQQREMQAALKRGLEDVHSGLAHLRARGLRRLTELVIWAADDMQTRQHFAASQRTASPLKLVPALLRVCGLEGAADGEGGTEGRGGEREPQPQSTEIEGAEADVEGEGRVLRLLQGVCLIHAPSRAAAVDAGAVVSLLAKVLEDPAAAAHSARLDLLLTLCVADGDGGGGQGVMAMRVQWGAAQVASVLHSPVAPPPARLAAAQFLVMLLSHVGPEAAAARESREEEEEEEAPRVDAGLDELLGAAALAEASSATPDELRGPGAAASLRRRARGVVERCLLSH